MASSKSGPTTPRAISPRPTPLSESGIGDRIKPQAPEQDQAAYTGPDALRATRGREGNRAEPEGLRPPHRNGSSNPSPSPTRFRQRPMSAIAPAVTVEPPQSPPKVRTLNLSLAGTSSYLSTDVPASAALISPSPRHFRIPSRPHTPIVGPPTTANA